MKQPQKRSNPRFDGPIPGENFTSDTKNYPWHRPPDEADYVAAVDRMIKAIAKPEKLSTVFTALEDGDTIIDVVVGALRLNIANGRYPIDVAILAAGPLVKYIETMATKHDIKFERGWQQKPTLMTKARLDAVRGKNAIEDVEEPVEGPAMDPAGGLMGMTDETVSPDVQNTMLGYGDEEQLA